MKASSGGTDADFPQDSPLVGATITVDHLVNVATIIEVQNRVVELTTDSDRPSKGWVKAPKLLGPVRWGHGHLWPSEGVRGRSRQAAERKRARVPPASPCVMKAAHLLLLVSGALAALAGNDGQRSHDKRRGRSRRCRAARLFVIPRCQPREMRERRDTLTASQGA
jgi:hypothetical protein